MKRTIFVVMAVLAVFAIVSCDNGTTTKPTPETFSVTFVAAGGTPTPTRITGVKNGDKIAAPTAMTKTGYDFGGWFKEEGLVNQWNFDSDTVTTDTVLFAKWTPQQGQIEPPPLDVARAEKVTLDNAWYAVYTFVLPEGKKWSDYKGVQASYMIEEEVLAGAASRGGRLMGPYQALDFTRYEGTAGSDGEGQILYAANYNGGKNAEFILDNVRGATPWGGSDAGSLVRDLLATDGISVVGGEWFTLSYTIDGSKKHGSFAAVNLPKSGATGPFYFGIGLPGQDPSGDDWPGTVQYIRDVTLIGYEDEDSVIGTPTWFKNADGEVLPVYTGYNTTNGTSGFKEAAREMADGSQPTPTDISPKDVVITFNYNYGDYTGANEPTPKKVPVLSYTALGAAAFPTAAESTRADLYTVASWNTKADATGTDITATSQLVASTVVYAQWAEPIEITLNLNYTGAAATTKTIGKGQSLAAADLVAVQAGYVLVGWNTKADGTGTAVTTTTVLTASAEIFAQWVAKAAADYVIGLATDDYLLEVILENAGGGTQGSIVDNAVTIASPRGGNGADAVRFSFGFGDVDIRQYEKISIAYTLTTNGTTNVAKFQLFAGQHSTTSINYFDLTGTSTPVIINIPTTAALVGMTEPGISFKLNPYGLSGTQNMDGNFTFEITSVTLVAYEDAP